MTPIWYDSPRLREGAGELSVRVNSCRWRGEEGLGPAPPREVRRRRAMA